MIKFECQCGQVIEAPDEMLGEFVRCPACHANFMPEKFLPVPARSLPAAAPALLRVANKIHHPYDPGLAAAKASGGGGAGMIIWPLVLVALLAVTFLGIIPLLFGVIFIFMAILGAIVSQLAARK